MKTMRYYSIMLIWFFGFCSSSMLFASNEQQAVVTLEHVAHQILQTLKTHQSELKSDHTIVMQAVRQYLLPMVDVVGMSRSVLGRQAWTQASIAEQKEFTQAFTELVIRTYAAPLSEYEGETITFSPQYHSDGHFSRVNSVIQRKNGQAIPLSYAMVMKDGSWKIYDLTVEGVSLLQSFKNQFAQALQGSDLKHLIHDMKQRQLAAL